MTTPFPVERIEEIQQRPDDFKLSERIAWTKLDALASMVPLALAPAVGDEVEVVFLDQETTGYDHEEEAITELGAVKMRYSPSKQMFTSLQDFISWYDDPGKPIPPEITALTGIRDEDVSGKYIDESALGAWLADAAVVVAHSASFDRPFFDKRFPSLAHLPWACSLKEVNWRQHGFEGAKLEYLAYRLGGFFTGHRAGIDAIALAWVLHQCPSALAELMHSYQRVAYVVRAYGSPFHRKDDLKLRGYKWNAGEKGANKHWWTEVNESELNNELDALEDLYAGASDMASIERMDATRRYKKNE